MPRTVSTLSRDRAHACRGLVTDLLVRCGQGDEAALAALFDLLHPVVTALAADRVPSRDITEVVLAAFSRVWRRAACFRPESDNGMSWMLTELAASVAEEPSSAAPVPA